MEQAQILEALGLTSDQLADLLAQAQVRKNLATIDSLSKSVTETKEAHMVELREQLQPIQAQIMELENSTSQRVAALAALRVRAERGEDVAAELTALEA